MRDPVVMHGYNLRNHHIVSISSYQITNICTSNPTAVAPFNHPNDSRKRQHTSLLALRAVWAWLWSPS